jgi:CHASE2 domain-containing sensor protein
MSFIATRIIIAFISAILLFFSITWNEKGGWKKTTVVLLVIIGLGSIANFAFSWGFAHYPGTTLLILVVILILGLLYIKFLEPKILKKKPKSKLPPEIYN